MDDYIVSTASTALIKAKQAASELVYGKEVTLRTHGLDKCRRTIADVLLPDGANVNHTLVKEGWGGWRTLVNRSGDRYAVLRGPNGGQRDFSRPAETVH